MSHPGDPEHTVRLAAETAMDAMAARLRRVVRLRDVTPILEAEALREARRLAELLPGEDDLAVHHLLGWFHWFRHQAIFVRTDPGPGQERDREQDRPDLRLAVHSLTASFLAGEEHLPEPLLPLLAENAAGYAARLIPELKESNDPARISCAAQLWRRIVDTVPAGHPQRPVHLTALGNVLRIKSRRGGPPADLDDAIDRFREALSAVSEEPGRAMYLYNLGEALNTRFDRTGAIEDLESAVTLFGEAARATPDEGIYRALVLTGLAGALRARYGRTGAPRDLDGSIARYREVVAMFPTDHPGRIESLSHLGNALRLRFERTGSTEDLNAAVQAGRQAVGATPEGRPGRAGLLSDLAVALRTRFLRGGLVADADEAIAAAREAVEAVPGDHPDRAVHLNDLGDALLARFDHAGDMADRDGALTAWSAVSAAAASTVSLRVRAGLSAARLLAKTGEAERAARAADEAVRLMAAADVGHRDRPLPGPRP
ncbi:hypothetical protein [Streptomyces sp. NPDC059918]|uniref:hypothetical protein n=1 Tax=unclassified Streptomyces TaxID=2593676 RepID=UPI003650E4B5